MPVGLKSGTRFPLSPLRAPGSHGRDLGSTRSDSLEFGWWGLRFSRWCRAPADPDPPWCCRRCSLRTAESHTPGCNCSCCFGSGGSSEETWKDRQTDGQGWWEVLVRPRWVNKLLRLRIKILPTQFTGLEKWCCKCLRNPIKTGGKKTVCFCNPACAKSLHSQKIRDFYESGFLNLFAHTLIYFRRLLIVASQQKVVGLIAKTERNNAGWKCKLVCLKSFIHM